MPSRDHLGTTSHIRTFYIIIDDLRVQMFIDRDLAIKERRNKNRERTNTVELGLT